MKQPRPLLLAALAAAGACLVTAPPAGAMDVPQSREEFVRAVSAGARGVRMETVTVDRPFDEVYRTFEARTAPCLDVEVRRSAYVGYMENSTSDYNPTLTRPAPDRAELTLQVVHRPRGVGHTPPAGGLYTMAVDIRRAGDSRTELVLYRPSMGYKDVTKSLLEWADGSGSDCPKLK